MLFKIAQLLAIFIFVSIPLMRENLRGLRENLKHKILSQVKSFKLNARKAAYKVTLVGFIYTFPSSFLSSYTNLALHKIQKLHS